MPADMLFLRREAVRLHLGAVLGGLGKAGWMPRGELDVGLYTVLSGS